MNSLIRTRAGLVVVALVAAVTLLPGVAQGLGPTPLSPNTIQVLQDHQVRIFASSTNEFSRVVPRRVASQSDGSVSAGDVQPGVTNIVTPTATFQVTYNGFTAQAQAAFQAAVDIWAATVVSSVPIKVNATWTALGPGILGSAGPTVLVRDFSGAPQTNTYYPVALANSLAGTDLYSGNDISASFSSAFSNWYFGTDGNTPAGQYDFESVVLHELGHGLGFIGSMSRNSSGVGSWGSGSGIPFAFDRSTANGSNQLLITAYPNNSTALGTQLVTNSNFFNGPSASSANGGTPARLYSPSTWSGGSSISHLDDATYPPVSGNALMTHAIGAAESDHDPGPVTVGIFEDMGWGVNGGSGGGTDNPLPSLSSLSPSSAVAGSAGFDLTVNGSGFVVTSVVNVNGSLRTTTFLGASQLRAAITAADVAAAGSFNVTVTSPAPGGGTSNSLSFTITAGGGGGSPVYLTVSTAQSLGGVAVKPNDVISYNGSYAMVFKGDSRGISGRVIDAMEVLPDGSGILLSFSASTTVPGVSGTVYPADVVKFTASTPGNYSAGSYSVFFRGSKLGLSSSSENVDAVSLANGKLYLSTTGSFSLSTGLSGQDHDVFACNGFTPGALTADDPAMDAVGLAGLFGRFPRMPSSPPPSAPTSGPCTSTSMYFDGEDVGLSLSSEDVDAFFVGSDGTLYFSTKGSFSSGPVSGVGNDVVACASPTTGTSTKCGSRSISFDGGPAGISGNVTGFSK